jgi:hypothetical protein
MSDANKKGDAKKVMLDVGVAAGTALVKTAASASPEATVVLAVLPKLVTAAIGPFLERRRRQSWDWWVSIATELGDDPDRIREEIEDRMLRDEHTAETVIASFHRMLDVVDDAVIPTLGALTAEYLAPPGRRRDRFFRNFGSLLAELDANVLGAIRHLWRTVQGVGGPVVHLRHDRNDGHMKLDLKTSDPRFVDLGKLSDGHAEEIIAALRQHGFHVPGASDAANTVSIRREDLQRMERLIRVEPLT